MHNAPWRVHQEVPGAPCGIYAPTEHGIGRIASCMDSSDARLIAAAPDLLKALERTLSWLTSYPGGGAMAVYDEARKATEKATGESA